MSAVEWKKLGEVCEVHTGEQLNRNDMVDDGQFPVINGGKEPSGYTNSFNEQANSITISQGGESAGYVNWIDKDFWAGAHCYVVENKENTVKKFLYYSLKNIEIILQSTKQGAGIPGLNRKKLYEQIIPIPSLAKQQEIVSHLDTFTTLISNLENELDMRRKQYEHYRNQLLDFEGVEDVECKTLGEIGDVTKLAGFEFTEHVTYKEEGNIIALRGLNVRNGYLDLSDVKYIDGSNFEKLGRSRLYINDMLFTYVGTIGNVALISENDKFYLAPNVSRIRFNESYIKSRFALYYFQCFSFVNSQINKYLNASSMKNLTMENIRKFLLPILPMPTQQEIVSKLDAFENLIQSLEQEIKLRKQQYEYYREKLLTFE